MSDVISSLEEAYGFQVHDQREAGGRTILETDRGLYNVYFYPQGYRYKKKLIDQVKKHLTSQAGLPILPVEKTKDSRSFLVIGDKMVYVQRGIRENPPMNYAFATGQALAEFHQGTAGFTGDKLFYPYRSHGSWPSMWRKKMKSFESIRESLESDAGEITPFDEYLLTTYTYVYHMGDTAIQYLQANGYQQMVKQTAPYGKIAFQNFDDGYVVFDERGAKRLAGEYAWVLDMRARDIGQWIKAEVRRNGYDPQVIRQFLAGYNRISPLLDEEYNVIYALFAYPGRFFRQVELYDQMNVQDIEFAGLREWTVELDQELLLMEDLLRRYPLLVEEEYGIRVPRIEWLWRNQPDEEDRLFIENQ